MTKEKIYLGLCKAKNIMDKTALTVGTVGTAILTTGISAFAEEGATSTPTIDFSSVDLSGLTTAITSVVPQVMPVAVTVLGIRKALSFFMGTIRGI